MKVSAKGLLPVHPYEIKALESCLSIVLDDSIKTFYENYNGVILQGNELSDDIDKSISITQFVPLTAVVDEIKLYGFRPGFIPIAWAEGGNYIVLSTTDKAIYFVDHEVENSYRVVAAHLGEFIDRLVPVDPLNSLPDGVKIKSVWIDPEFLKRIQSGEFK
jgi:hypothetical protein